MIAALFILASVLLCGYLFMVGRRRRALRYEHYFTDMLLGSDVIYSRAMLQLDGHFGSGVARLAAARVVARLGALIYRIDEGALREFSVAMHLEEYFVRRALRRGGFARRESLLLLSQMPISYNVVQEIATLRGRDREVDFLVMMATINGDRSRAVEHLASYKYIMYSYEVTAVLEMLGRGVVSVAYQPLLLSESLNLNLIALALVERFGIESASDMVAALAQDSTRPQVRARAVEVLTSMQLPVAIDLISSYIDSLKRCERYALLRHLSSAGYSSSSLKGIITTEERLYFQSVVKSYKVRIEC